MKLDFLPYDEDIEVRRGIFCEKKASVGKKAKVVSFDECLRCQERPRCIERRAVIDFAEREEGGYYDDRYGAFHVTSTFFCKRKKQSNKIIGNVYRPKDIWNMVSGRRGHEDLEEMKLDNMMTERQLVYDFESGDGDELRLKGKFDGYIKEVSKDLLDRGPEIYDILEGTMFSGGIFDRVLEELKTKKTLKYNMPSYGVSEANQIQTLIYISLNERLGVVDRPKAIYTNYINRFEGQSIGYLKPVLVKGTALEGIVDRKLGDEVDKTGLIRVNPDVIIDKAMSRVETIHRNTRDGNILGADSEWDWECGNCPYQKVCEKFPDMIISDKEKERYRTALESEFDWSDAFFDSCY